jgi:hypothetical protein
MFDVGWMIDGWMFDEGWMMLGPVSPRARRQHTSAYISIRQHAPAYVSIRQHTGFAARETLKIQDSRAQQHLHVP